MHTEIVALERIFQIRASVREAFAGAHTSDLAAGETYRV